MSQYQGSFQELMRPVTLLVSATARIFAEYPQLSAWLRKSEWFSSPLGMTHYRPEVWFDGKVYHAIVYHCHGREPAKENSSIVWQCRRHTWDSANRSARRMALKLATMKNIF